MKKIALHWWILIGLFLGILTGYLLAPYYIFDDVALSKLKQVELEQKISEDVVNLIDKHLENDIKTAFQADKKIPGEIITKLGSFANQKNRFDNSVLLRSEIIDLIGENNSDKYFPHIKRVSKVSRFNIENISWLGDFFLNALKLIIIPLILTSIISGVTSIGNGENLGRLGFKTLSYYLLSSLLAIIVGLVLVNIFQPGAGIDFGLELPKEAQIQEKFKWYSIFLSVVHPNLIDAMANGKMLAVITFSVLFGVFILNSQEEQKRVLKDFFNASFQVMMKITMLIIKLTPIGVFAIVTKVVANAISEGTLIYLAGSLLWYSTVVLLGLIIHSLVVLPLLMRYIGKVKNPFAHLSNMAVPLLNAFGTASSSATLPLTMDALENKAKVSNKITSFTIPLGATVNMDGTALYECVAAIFIAQTIGDFDLTIGTQLIIVITALTASIGAAGIPGAGLVMMSVIFIAVGLPLEGVAFIVVVDRILDMCRTAVNVWSDSCGAVIIAKSEGETTAYDQNHFI